MNKYLVHSGEFYKKTLFVSIIVLCTACLLLFISFSAFIYQNNINAERESLAINNQKCFSQIDNTFETCTRICMYFASYKTISPVFQSKTDIDLQKSTLTEEVETYISCFDYIASIYVDTGTYNVKGGTHQVSDFTDAGNYNSFKISYSSGNQWPHLIRFTYISESNSFLNVSIDIYAEYIGNQYLNDNTYCINNDGIIVISKDTKCLGKNISEISDFSIKDIKLNKFKSKAFHSCLTIDNASLSLIAIEDTRAIMFNLFYKIILLSVVFILTMSVSVIIVYFILRKIYTPISNTIEILKCYLPDNNDFAEDHIEYIENCIAKQNLERSTNHIMFQIRKSQLYVLHSQISPHFLGNSLDIVKWEAARQLGIENSISESIAILSNFLNEAHEYTKMFVTIESEIERTKQYIRLAKYCFNSSLEFLWDVEESTLRYSIISLTLQPILENSILHGYIYADENKQPVISIKINTEGENIRITISDNGNGMEPKVLNELQKIYKEKEPPNNHIGIKNTHMKLKILYGEKYGINYIKSDSNGTTTSLLIPKYFFKHH